MELTVRDCARCGLIALTALAVLTLATGAMAAQAAAPVTHKMVGETKPMGNGTVQSWFMVDQNNAPMAIGVTFTEAALSGLPNTLPYTEYPLMFPPGASVTPFTHFVANWNPQGHIPPGVYTVPHFDFHFYLITPQVREQITTTGPGEQLTIKQPPAGVMPKDYITAPGLEEARMGLHWADKNAPEFHGKPFTYSLIYGSYNGQLAFVEPMITRAFLETRKAVSEPLPQPGVYPAGLYYPTHWSLHYDQARKEYTLSLEGMVKR